MKQEVKDYGIELFGSESKFNIWLNSETINMPKKPINYTDEEIYVELQRIAWGIF